MDFQYFIENKKQIEVAEKPGLYIVMQNHLPQQYQAFRLGLAGKPVDSATSTRLKDSNFAGRLGMYLQTWLPTSGTVFAVLTVPRTQIMGFAERVMPAREENDNRPDYARLHLSRSLIGIREEQYHRLALRYGMRRLTMPGVDPNKSRSEFFKGTLQQAMRALKSVGVGDLYTFSGNNINQIQKQTLKRGDVIQTQQVPLRGSARFTVNKDVVDLLQADDPPTKRAVERLAKVKPASTRRSPRLAGELVFEAPKDTLDALARGDRRTRKALQALGQVRRSPRLAERVA